MVLTQTQTREQLLLLLELRLQLLPLQVLLTLLAGQLLAQLGRLPQNVHLGRPLLVTDVGYLLFQGLEQILQTDATLTLHVVVLIPLLDRIGLVQTKLTLQDAAAAAADGAIGAAGAIAAVGAHRGLLLLLQHVARGGLIARLLHTLLGRKTLH